MRDDPTDGSSAGASASNAGHALWRGTEDAFSATLRSTVCSREWQGSAMPLATATEDVRAQGVDGM